MHTLQVILAIIPSMRRRFTMFGLLALADLLPIQWQLVDAQFELTYCLYSLFEIYVLWLCNWWVYQRFLWC